MPIPPAESTVSLSVRLRCFSRRDGRRWVAGCPRLDVFSQGEREGEARTALKVAIGLWFESCIERGTLEAALREVGFRPLHRGELPSPEADAVMVRRAPAIASSVGRSFEIAAEIPAFIAARLLEPETASPAR